MKENQPGVPLRRQKTGSCISPGGFISWPAVVFYGFKIVKVRDKQVEEKVLVSKAIEGPEIETHCDIYCRINPGKMNALHHPLENRIR